MQHPELDFHPLSLFQPIVDVLHQSEMRLMRLADSLPGTIFQFRLSPGQLPRFLFFSANCANLLGAHAEAIQQDVNHLLAQLHPDDLDGFLTSIATLNHGLHPWHWQGRLVGTEGKTRWVRAIAHPNPQPDGSTLWDGLLIDITQHKQLEQSLHSAQTALRDSVAIASVNPSEAEHNLRAIFDGVNDALIIHTQDGHILDVNARVLDLFGLSREQATQFLLHEDYSSPSNAADLFLQRWPKVLAGEPQFFEWRARRPIDGSEFDAEVALRPLMLNGQAVILASVHDVTLRKATEEALRESETKEREKSHALEQALHELQQTQFQLVQSEKMSSLGQLVAGVAHEINNPVNFIYGNLTYAMQYTQDLLKLLRCYQNEYPLPLPRVQAALDEVDLEFLMDDMPRLLNSMKVGADRIRDIVRSLRNFSRLDEADVKPVDIHEGLDSTLMILQNRLKPKPNLPAIALVKHYGTLPLVECFAGQLNQVFMNILSNAIDALEERDAKRKEEHDAFENEEPCPSTITITTELSPLNLNSAQPASVLIRIADNGPGIPEAVQKRLFDPFFTTKPVGKGTGLGMSISQQIIVEKHGGQLWCQSFPGKGTEFFIQIPLIQREVAQPNSELVQMSL